MSEAADREAKTEQPTEKRLSDARKKGNVPFSRDAPVMLNTAALWVAVAVFFPGAALQVAVALRPFLDQPGMWALHSPADISLLLRYFAGNVAIAVVPILALFALSGLAGSIPQSSGLTLSRIAPELSRISPASGWKRIFGRAGLSNSAKSLLRIGLLAVAAIWSLRRLLPSFIVAHGFGTGELAHVILASAAALIRDLLLVIVVVAAADVLLVRYFWRRDLMMTKQEIKDEAKEADGDQALKHRMRMLARQRLKRRMMAAVPRATVVIANPTHFAVALRYVKEEGGAPRVVAKGQDSLALRIRAVAEQSNVPVIEDKPLARALYSAVPVDSFIPAEFYRAVAQIISMLMRRTPKPAVR